MHPKTIAAFCGRVILSGALALALLTAFCCLYSNPPVHFPDPDGATDYRWEPNTFYSQATEGFSWGYTNNEGYYNPNDYHPGDRVDVLIMGSSHMEAGNVAPEESTASVLASKLDGKTVYNIGTSGHRFLICADNLAKAVEKYAPSTAVVIETETMSFSDDTIRQVLDGTLADIPSYNSGIIGILQREPFLRQLYHQWQSYQAKNAGAADDSEAQTGENDERLLDELMKKIQADAAGVRVIVFYHPSVEVGADGAMTVLNEEERAEQFRRLCEENGIYFLDMSERFLREYAENYTLPYGFSNTSVGSGHLNKYGHAMIADELYKLLSEVA